MDLQLPTVTIDDLRDFHAKHFPNVSLPQHFLQGRETQAPEAYYYCGDDSLGYCEDGVRRTLTDEQIALFRHTEIQTILRERRRQRETGEDLPKQNSACKLSPTPAADRHFQDSLKVNESSISLTHVKSSSNGIAVVKMQGTRVEKQGQWRISATDEKQKRKNAKSRKKNRQLRSGKGKGSREGSHAAGQRGNSEKDGEMSDEWDPWHQANGPDAIKDTTVDLEY